MAVILDDVESGLLTAFGTPKAIIRADDPAQVLPALAAISQARNTGKFLAGYIAYEAGYALEPHLAPLQSRTVGGPLLWLGVFETPPQTVSAEALGGGRAYAGPLRPEWDLAAYSRHFDRVKAFIAAGDFYQANLTFRARFAFAGDPLGLYLKLRAASGARYGAYIDDGTRQILSLSPELFFEIGDGAITAKPMKGTAARAVDPLADAAARDSLAASTKNRAENLMIVDLLRNDIGRIAELGSVGVRDLFAIETYPTVHQMVSTVSARLKPDIGIVELVKALFPCGSITGAPKIRAMEAIAELEASPRGIYCGAVGYFAPDGSARFNVAIRTLTIANGSGELGVGGGIVQDSDGADEYAEALLKARYFESGRRPIELIETLRWSAAEGFVRLERHLGRMAQSAQVFGLPFVRDQALAALEEATYALALPGQDPVAHRLRLTLDESGAFTCTTARLGPSPAVWTVTLSAQPVVSSDALVRHKTDWREQYAAAPSGCDEILFCNERGELAEGSRSNIFVAREGLLLTPPLSAGILDGVLRRELIETGRAREAVLRPLDLDGEFYLGNSLRGLIRGRLV